MNKPKTIKHRGEDGYYREKELIAALKAFMDAKVNEDIAVWNARKLLARIKKAERTGS